MHVPIHHWKLKNIRKQHLQKHVSVTLSNGSKHSNEIYFYKYFKKCIGLITKLGQMIDNFMKNNLKSIYYV